MIGRRARLSSFASSPLLLTPALLLTAPPHAQEQAPGQAEERPFDGTSLDGWDGDPEIWSVRDGRLAGSTRGRPSSLIWLGGPVGDFELSLEFALEGQGDAAVRYRCRRTGGAGSLEGGYEFGLHRQPDFFGRLYERDGRGIIARRGERVATHSDNVLPRVHGRLAKPQPLEPARWHRVRIVARGSVIVHEVDGVAAVEVDDRWKKARRSGWLALELRGGAPTAVAFRDLRLRRLPAVLATPRPAAGAGAAKRIWCPDSREHQELWLRRHLLLRTPVKSAPLTISCDNSCRVFVNGALILTADDWQKPVTVDVAAHLRIGDNVIAIHAANTGGPAALAFWLSWSDPAGGGGNLTSDGEWRFSDEEHKGWEQPRFDGKTWKPVHVLDGDATLGQTVWGTPPCK